MTLGVPLSPRIPRGGSRVLGLQAQPPSRCLVPAPGSPIGQEWRDGGILPQCTWRGQGAPASLSPPPLFLLAQRPCVTCVRGGGRGGCARRSGSAASLCLPSRGALSEAGCPRRCLSPRPRLGRPPPSCARPPPLARRPETHPGAPGTLRAAAASLPPGASRRHPRGPSAARSLRPGTRQVAIAASLARRRDSSAGPRRRRDYFRGRGGGAGRAVAAALLRLLSPRGLVAHSSREASGRPFPRRNLAARGGLLFLRGRLRGRRLHLIQGFSYHMIQETLMDPHFIIYQIGFIDGTKLQQNLLNCIKVDHQPAAGAKKRQGHTYTCGGIAQSSGNFGTNYIMNSKSYSDLHSEKDQKPSS
ncbi:uncharacterized protein LOC114599966 [Podarcis muralis]